MADAIAPLYFGRKRADEMIPQTVGELVNLSKFDTREPGTEGIYAEPTLQQKLHKVGQDVMAHIRERTVSPEVPESKWWSRRRDIEGLFAEPDYAWQYGEVDPPGGHIAAAAIKLKNGKILTGATHHQAMEQFDELYDIGDWGDLVEDANGFVTNRGEFISRQEAVRRTRVPEVDDDATELVGMPYTKDMAKKQPWEMTKDEYNKTIGLVYDKQKLSSEAYSTYPAASYDPIDDIIKLHEGAIRGKGKKVRDYLKHEAFHRETIKFKSKRKARYDELKKGLDKAVEDSIRNDPSIKTAIEEINSMVPSEFTQKEANNEIKNLLNQEKKYAQAYWGNNESQFHEEVFASVAEGDWSSKLLKNPIVRNYLKSIEFEIISIVPNIYHKAHVEKAIAEGKISFHPDYPELSKVK